MTVINICLYQDSKMFRIPRLTVNLVRFVIQLARRWPKGATICEKVVYR